MTEFMLAVIRIARFLAIAAAVLLLAVAAGLLFAPELLWQILRYTLVFLCLGGAGAILFSMTRAWFRQRKPEHH